MRAVIFDFDGTLADSFTIVVKIAYDLTKHEQLADINRALEMRRQHQGLTQAAKELNIPRWRWPSLLRRGRKIMSHEIHKVPLVSGMDEVLKRLNAENYEMFIISSNSRSNVEHFLAAKGIAGYFKNVYGGSGLLDKARVIKRVLKANNLKPDAVIYVGDEVRDIVAAKQVNMPCIAVSWGYNSEELLLRYSPTILARDPMQLANVISEWGKTI